MILVIMGMEVHPFDRLARAIDDLASAHRVDETFFVQLGACRYEPRTASFERYLSFGALCEKIRASSVVITHAGAGSTLTCIQQGKHPILVPRRAKEGEHIDDHQLPFTQKMVEIGHATALYEMNDLEATIRDTRNRTAEYDSQGSARDLVDWLETYWAGLARR